MKSQFVLRAASGTHPGQARTVNQDSVLAYIRPVHMGDALGIFIVADGMGGHQAGEVASQLAVETIRQQLSWMLDQDDTDATIPVPVSNDSQAAGERTAAHLEKRLQVAVEEANSIIYDYSQQNPEEAGNLGCTVTCAIVQRNIAVVANVGDSRTYRLSEGDLQQITEDHSYVGQLVRDGQIHSEEIFDHPQRNVITRALGNRPEVRVDLQTCTLEIGDRLLLCSDGVWEMIRDPSEIKSMLQEEELESAVQGLIAAANDYGGTDNIGLVVAELSAA